MPVDSRDRDHDVDDDPIVADSPHADTSTLRRPDVPVTLGELAALKGDAVDIITARVQILDTLRYASIRATHPEDWVLFRARVEDGGQIVAYLEDAGCDRVRGLWGIRIYNIGAPEKIVGVDPGDFMYEITGDGECTLTHEIVEHMEGGRSSKDDFCKGKTGAALDMAVRKAARANLDGGITRELAGMKSVPLQELERAWAGTPKTTDRCRKGRGFGTQNERVGGFGDKGPAIDPPVCAVCGAPGVYRPGKDGRPPFYGCPKYQNHPNQKWTVKVDDWVQQHATKSAPKTPPPPKNGAPKTTAPTVDEVFGKKPADREPGSDDQ